MVAKTKLVALALVGMLVLTAVGCTDLVVIKVNRPPVILVNAFPTQGTAPFTVEFDASDSSDPDSDRFTINWYFIESGIVKTGTRVTYTFEDDSDFNNDGWHEGYHIRVVAVDTNGNASDIDLPAVIVYNPAPVANFKVKRNSTLTLVPITFDATDSYDPAGIIIQPRGKIIEYRWDFGDGVIAYGVAIQHIYHKKGNYPVTLTLTDDDFAVNRKTMIVNVDNRIPVAKISYWLKSQGVQPQGIIIIPKVFVFDGSGSFDEDGSVVKYVWYFSDDVVLVGKQVERTFDRAGYYKVVLEVTDDNGDVGQARLSFRI